MDDTINEQRAQMRLQALINQAAPGAQWWSRDEVLALRRVLDAQAARIATLEQELAGESEWRQKLQGDADYLRERQAAGEWVPVEGLTYHMGRESYMVNGDPIDLLHSNEYRLCQRIGPQEATHE